MADDDADDPEPEVPPEWRDWLVRADHQASRDYDRTITALASGALGLSIAFIHEVAPHPRDIGWIVAAWALFALSLLLILGSFLTSMSAIRRDIDAIDNNRRVEPSASTDATEMLNLTSMGALIAGAVCLVVFASLNL